MVTSQSFALFRKNTVLKHLSVLCKAAHIDYKDEKTHQSLIDTLWFAVIVY